MKNFLYLRDLSGAPSDSFEPSENIYGVLLAQNVAQSFTVPGTANKWFVKFSYQPSSNVVVRHNGTATVADGTIGAETSEYRPSGWLVSAGDTVSFITPDSGGAYVYASLYSIS